MQYEGQICRAPMERASFMLPVAVGCSYNACKFCTLDICSGVNFL